MSKSESSLFRVYIAMLETFFLSQPLPKVYSPGRVSKQSRDAYQISFLLRLNFT